MAIAYWRNTCRITGFTAPYNSKYARGASVGFLSLSGQETDRYECVGIKYEGGSPVLMKFLRTPEKGETT